MEWGEDVEKRSADQLARTKDRSGERVGRKQVQVLVAHQDALLEVVENEAQLRRLRSHSCQGLLLSDRDSDLRRHDHEELKVLVVESRTVIARGAVDQSEDVCAVAQWSTQRRCDTVHLEAEDGREAPVQLDVFGKDRVPRLETLRDDAATDRGFRFVAGAFFVPRRARRSSSCLPFGMMAR